MSKLQGTPEWFINRVGKITASRAGGILNLSPFADDKSVMREMVREYHGLDSEIVVSAPMQWGTDHEDEAIAAYEAESGNFVESTGFHQHVLLKWLGASPDGLVSDDGLIEVKAPYSKKLESIDTKPHYYAQIQVQLACCDRDWCDFVTWTPNGMTIERVMFDGEWANENIPKLKAFYDEYLLEIDNPDSPHLEPLELDMSDNIAWLRAEAKYGDALEAAAEAKRIADSLKEQMVSLSGGKKAKGSRFQLFPVERKGSIQYAKAIKDLAPGADLEKYRGKPSESWTIKEVKK